MKPADDPAWVDIPKVAQRIRIRPGAILGLVSQGALTGRGKVPGARDYGGLRVQPADVERLIVRRSGAGMTIRELETHVGLGEACAGRLIKRGPVSSTIAPNPVTKASQHFMGDADIADFNARYITLRQLTDFLADTWQALLHRMRDVGLERFSGGGNDYGNIFLWADVERRLVCRWSAKPRG